MPIEDDFAVAQAGANVTLESMKLSDNVCELVAQARLSKLTTTDILKILIDGRS